DGKHRELARGDRRLSRRVVRDACAEPQRRAVLGHEGEEDVRLFPEDVTIEDPGMCESALLRELRQRDDAIERVVGLEREAELHRAGSVCTRATSRCVARAA